MAKCIKGADQVLSYQAHQTIPHLLRNTWDATLDFTGSDRSTLLTALSRASHRIGYRRFADKMPHRLAYTELSPASVRLLHTTDFHLALAAQLLHSPLPEPVHSLPLEASPQDQIFIDQLIASHPINRPIAILHPGTARMEKFWTLEGWTATARSLHDQGLQPLLTGTGSGLEADIIQQLRQQLGGTIIDLTGRLSLPQMAALISRARIAIGVDSMAMHLAALQHIPQIVLFGPTNPFHWRPRHAQAHVITPNQSAPSTEFSPTQKGQPMTGIHLSTVLNTIQQMLSLNHSMPSPSSPPPES